MMKIGNPLRMAALAGAVLGLGACSWLSDTVDSINPFSEKKAPRIAGERKPVLTGESEIQPDAALAAVPVALPRPTANKDWPQAGGYPDHAMHHLALSEVPARAWSSSIGSGSSSERRLLAQPVVGDGRVYTLDSRGRVRAFDAAAGSQIWDVNVLPKGQGDANLGGGVGFWRGRLYVATGAAELVALDAASGKEAWRSSTGAAVRGAPTVAGGRVFIVNSENEVLSFNADSGERGWNAAGVAEPTGILGAANPAVEGSVVVAAQSSGDVVAMRVESGRVLWQERLAASRQINPITNIADITAKPVIDRGLVLAVSNAGRLAAIDIRTGRRIWDVDIGALQTPWVAGDWIFALSNEGQLLAIDRRGGKVRWARNLNAYAPDRAQKRGIVWTGPVLAGDRLVVAGSHGEALSLSPYTGEVKGRLPLNDGVMIAPVVAGGTIFFLDDGGRLVAMR